MVLFRSVRKSEVEGIDDVPAVHPCAVTPSTTEAIRGLPQQNLRHRSAHHGFVRLREPERAVIL
jgi:hypothetical protein